MSQVQESSGKRRTRKPRAVGSTRRGRGAALLLQAAHPRQAVVLAVVVGVGAALSHRAPREVAVAAAAVLLTQLAAGLHNDVSDAAIDRAAASGGKPIASGELPAGNAVFVAALLVLLAIPVSLQSGTIAGLALLATLPIAYAHNILLHRTILSFAGWMLCAALYATFLAYGGWGGGRHGAAPSWQMLLAAAFVGLCAHFATTLPDLVQDHAAGLRSLPLRIALRTGATPLLIATALLSVLAAAALVAAALEVGLRA